MSRREHSGRRDQQKASLHRRADARKLLEEDGKDHTRGAVYLGGHAIECKLKAIAMERHGCWTLEQLAQRLKVSEDEVFHHGVEVFLKRLGLLKKLLDSEAKQPFVTYVNRWRPIWRYDPSPVSVEWAKAFLAAVDKVYNWLDANRC